MRKVIVCNIVSLDGFTADPDGNPLVLTMDDAFNTMNRERIEAAGTVLLGRTSYQMFSSYWPHIADAPADPANPALDETNRAISRRYNAIPKVVVSDTLTVPEDNPWAADTTVIKRDEVAGWLAGDDRGDVLIFGSRTMWNGLLEQNLVDELHLMVSPVALGAGTPAFSGRRRLELLGTHTFEGSGNVVVRYEPT